MNDFHTFEGGQWKIYTRQKKIIYKTTNVNYNFCSNVKFIQIKNEDD